MCNYIRKYRPKGEFCYKKFARARRANWFSMSVAGQRKPSYWLKRPSKSEINAAARRCVREGDIRSAVELVCLAHSPEQLTLRLL